ncbi:hypothetical protein ASG84_24625 [Rhodococcus sp. Leaf278]|nr:hypothetical protein ASG84_24625 [Rhodococcus sp. Leaf278]
MGRAFIGDDEPIRVGLHRLLVVSGPAFTNTFIDDRAESTVPMQPIRSWRRELRRSGQRQAI